ncbi:amidohydrolase family protein [Nocardia sp. NPDC020380]|uniref:amidohydrolase family protein n=1 Tax=Nocardia sp. NPDC020380 TaxID=3364309 RepID=UPI0037BB1FC7
MTVRIIDAARILTGHGTAHTPGSIVIDGAMIGWVGRTADLPPEWVQLARERVELAEATLLPGLIDAHVHLAFDCGFRPPDKFDDLARTAVADTIRAATTAATRSGVTTVRDMGAPRYIDADTLPANIGPRVLTSTIPLTVPGGQAQSLGGVVATVADVERVIAENARRGAAWIKAVVTGGRSSGGRFSPYEPQFTDELLRAIVTTAHHHNLPVAALAHGTAGIRQAVEIGVDSLEYCTWMAPGGFDVDHGLIREIAARRIAVCPIVDQHARTSARLPWRHRRDHLRTMLTAGIPLLPGTDSGTALTPHGGLGQALTVYTDLGLTPATILELATRQAATTLGIGHLTGTLTPGLAADILAVPGNPTQNLHTLTAPVVVVTAGHLQRLGTKRNKLRLNGVRGSTPTVTGV